MSNDDTIKNILDLAENALQNALNVLEGLTRFGRTAFDADATDEQYRAHVAHWNERVTYWTERVAYWTEQAARVA